MKRRSFIAILLILVMSLSLPLAIHAEIPLLEPPRLPLASSYSGGTVGNLTEEETEELRCYLAEKVCDFEEYIDLTAFRLPYTAAIQTQIMQLLWYETPEAFHFYSGSLYTSMGKITKMRAIYRPNHPKDVYNEVMKEIDAVAAEMTADLVGLGEAEKALIIHDRLALHCEYAYEELLNGTVYDNNDFFTIVGPLANQRGVCHGYTLSYTYLMRKAGIKSRMVISEALNHSWNVVTVNGKEYHVDVTHDDPVWDETGYVRHINFLRSSAGIYSTSHKASDYDTSPSDTTYDNAFWQNSHTAFQYVGGKIYYLDDNDFTIRRYEDHSVLLQEEDYWYLDESSYYACQSKLDSDGTYILYSKAKCIMRVNPLNGETEVVLRPEITEPYHNIYGFTLDGDTLVMEIFDSGYYNSETKKLYQRRYAYEEPIGTEDVILLLQYLTGAYQTPDLDLMDRNGDSKLTIADAVMMVRALAA